MAGVSRAPILRTPARDGQTRELPRPHRPAPSRPAPARRPTVPVLYRALTLGTPRPEAARGRAGGVPTSPVAGADTTATVRRPEHEVFAELLRAPACAAPGRRAPVSAWVVLGEPGSGKSTLLCEWARRGAPALARPVLGRPTPLYVRLRDCTEAMMALPLDAFTDALWARGVETTREL